MAALPPLDMSALEGVALRDSGSSFLISPLPQFTNALPSVLGGIAPLPELTEDIDGEEKEEEDEEEISTPDSAHHGRPNRRTSGLPQTQSGDTIPPEQSDHFKAMQVSESHATHYHRARSHSIPSHSTSPGSPPSGRSASASPPKLALHDLHKLHPVDSSSYPHHTRETYTPAIRISNPDGDALRSRLHDLLRDSPTSSSLPNMSSTHFAASLNKVDRDSSAPNTSSSPLISCRRIEFRQDISSDTITPVMASLTFWPQLPSHRTDLHQYPHRFRLLDNVIRVRVLKRRSWKRNAVGST
jgi:hypothetical protein